MNNGCVYVLKKNYYFISFWSFQPLKLVIHIGYPYWLTNFYRPNICYYFVKK